MTSIIDFAHSHEYDVFALSGFDSSDDEPARLVEPIVALLAMSIHSCFTIETIALKTCQIHHQTT
jgi:hypothetical protein